MDKLKISFWNETFILDDILLKQLSLAAVEDIQNTIGRHLIIDHQFKLHKIPKPEDLQNFGGEQNEKAIFLYRLKQLKEQVIHEQSIREYFLKQKTNLERVIFGLIRLESRALAEELYYQIRDDQADFTLLARRYSKGPERQHGGIIGPKNLSQVSVELRELISQLQEGELNSVFTLDNETFYVLKLFQRQIPVLNETTLEIFRDELFDQWLSQQLKLANSKLIESKQIEAA